MTGTCSTEAPITFTCASPADTQELAARLGAALQAGDVLALFGDLGAGKTCFVQGLARGMGIEANVTSPTFIIMRHHPGRPALCHADAYRLESPEELEDLGVEDVLREAVLAVEWAERVLEALPPERVEARLSPAGDQARQVEITGRGPELARRVREALQ